MMVGEIHCHTNLSKPLLVHRALPSPKDVVDVAVRVGLDFLAITDHDTMDAFGVIREYAFEQGLVLIPAIEITTKPTVFLRRRAHILALGLRETVDSFMSIEDTIYEIHKQNGMAIAAHPFCSKFAKTLYLGHQVGDYAFDGVEVFNSSEDDLDNKKAEALAVALNLPGFAGSDAHGLKNIGRARIEVDIAKTDDWRKIMDALKKGRFRISKRGKSVQTFRQFVFGHFMRKFSM